MLTIDLETHKPAGFKAKKKAEEKPDFRIDEVDRYGWLDEGDTAHWSECPCPLPYHPSQSTSLLGHNMSYDLGILHRDEPKNFPLRKVDIHDTLAMAYSLGEDDLSLKGLMQKYLGVQTVSWEQQDLVGADQYHAQDLFGTRDLAPLLLSKVRGTSYDIDRKLIPALIECTLTGYVIDQDRLRTAGMQARQKMNKLQRAFDTIVEGKKVLKSRRKKTTKAKGTEYVEVFGPPDIGSPSQLGRLFEMDSVGIEKLAPLATQSTPMGQAAWLRLQWVEHSKLLTTYYLPKMGREIQSGLFNITPPESGEGGTEGGRLSSERDNQQNTTPPFNRCLRAPDNYILVRPDYSQIELRVAAEWSQDPYLLEVMKIGSHRDPHMETRDFFRPYLPGWCECGPVKCPHRDDAKRFNFGALYYGQAAYLSSVMKVPVHVGAELLEVFHGHWTGFYAAAERHWDEVQRYGYSELPEPFRQRRNIPLVGNLDHAKKVAINHPIQGTAAYITKLAMNRLFYEGFWLVNQVHDSIHIFIHKDDNLEWHETKIKRIMEETAREFLPTVGGPVEIQSGIYWE